MRSKAVPATHGLFCCPPDNARVNIAARSTSNAQPHPDARPLWRDLLACAQLVGAVQEGASLSAALPRQAASGRWDAAQRGAAQALSFAVLRHLGTARALLGQFHPKAVHPPLLRDLLHTALVLLLPRSPAHYATHTVVNQAVEACKRTPTLRHAAGFVNALLRRALGAPDKLNAAIHSSPEARWNHPEWWIAALQQAHPQHWEQMLEVAQIPPAMTLRVNPRHVTRTAYLELLEKAGLHATVPATDTRLDQALILAHPVPVEQLPGFAAGWVSVQDAAAQYAAPLLDVQPRMRVLDACAAPGGKTAHLLERVDCEVLALDKDPQRLQRVDGTLRRLGLRARLLAADAARPADWWDGQPFDRILLDAPCSASGIERRHPDIRWLRRAGDIAALAGTQAALLDALWPLLAPAGKLLYVTCSVFPQEGTEQAGRFLTRHADAIASPAPGQLLPQEPRRPVSTGRDDAFSASPAASTCDAPVSQDGFFYALFTKQP